MTARGTMPPCHADHMGDSGGAITVVLADDERFVRTAIKTYLAAEEDIEVIGEAADGQEALDAVAELSPDVLLLDLQMPGLDGLAATRQLVESGSDTRVLVVTGHVSDEFIAPVLTAGASGYALKDAEPDALIQAIRDVADGGCPVDPSVTHHLVDAVRRSGPPAPPGEVQLTDREREVLDLLCEGRSNREIAGALFLSEPTVKYYLSGLMQKLEARDRVQLVVNALRGGLA